MAISLNKIPGIGPKSAAHLQGLGIDSAEALLAVGTAALLGAPGFHEARANAVLEAAAGLVIAEEESVKTSPVATGEETRGKKKKQKKGKKKEKAKKEKGKKKKDKKKDKKKGKKKKKKEKKG